MDTVDPAGVPEAAESFRTELLQDPIDASTVLVIDDDAQIRRLVALSMKTKGYQVVEACEADEGIRMLQRLTVSGMAHERACVVLLDIMMPGVDGLTLCRRIKNEFSVPVIMCSGRAAQADVTTAIRNGADDYLVKPFHFRTLVEKVTHQFDVLRTVPLVRQ